MLGETLKNLRIEFGYTMKQVANEIEVAEATVSKYEANKIKPTSEIIIKLAKLYKVSTDYLLGIEDEYGAKINARQNGGMIDNSRPSVRTVAVNEEHRELLEKYKKAPKEIQRAVQKLLS